MYWLVNLLHNRTSRQNARASRSQRRAALHLEMLEDRLQPSATSSITDSFFGPAINAGSTIWFSSKANVTGVGTNPATLSVINASIHFTSHGTAYNVPVPNATVTFSPTATTASTVFDTTSGTWETTVPSSYHGSVFLAGAAFAVPVRLPADIHNVTWTATFQTDTKGMQVDWHWAAAVYSSFSTNYGALNVKAVHSSTLTAYHNFDATGTPEAFKSFVVAGARGAGHHDYTGQSTGFKHVTPAVVTPPPGATLSGTVYVDNNNNQVLDSGDGTLAGVTVFLTGTTATGQTITLSTTTNSSGVYSFGGLAAGTYSISETAPGGYQNEVANLGSLGGTPSLSQVSSINVTAGATGTGYNFGDVVQSGNS
jgi:hypothetical protein